MRDAWVETCIEQGQAREGQRKQIIMRQREALALPAAP